MDVDGVAILARGIAARGPEGIIFADLDLRVEPGALAVVAGPSGTGRTSLLLALSGRLPLITGHLDVSGHVLPAQAKAVRQLIRPARLRPGYELEAKHRVREAIVERRLISGVSERSIDAALDKVRIAPDRTALIDELHPAERLLLAVALTVASEPAGILVDDVDAGLPTSGRAQVWAGLREVARTGMTVLASATDPPSGDVDVIPLPAREPDRPTKVLDLQEEVTR
ncbi:ATP-binding cassette domain-containing protein [Saccharopolyspora sp. ASAGF58]|uniref:ATP-binding cassette domain-containing protein n=1 Tax=Saccharopolyspora sp. ASAGF58 TaxID=2719023 RepID=UPI0014401C20|nr:ATP-binding cassette domain-containing protein [Saccharopolyspora sp. ASAGF58]QIZ35588.1 ATP-binding cassette domain-containing protein [Saccharopolyspora sp. ASAGF58]